MRWRQESHMSPNRHVRAATSFTWIRIWISRTRNRRRRRSAAYWRRRRYDANKRWRHLSVGGESDEKCESGYRSSKHTVFPQELAQHVG